MVRADRKSKLVNFTPTEWAAVERRAAAMRMSTTRYIRFIATYGEVKWYDIKAYHLLEMGMNAIGRNIDQIARVANSTRSVYAADMKHLQELMTSLKALFHAHFDEAIHYDLIE